MWRLTEIVQGLTLEYTSNALWVLRYMLHCLWQEVALLATPTMTSVRRAAVLSGSREVSQAEEEEEEQFTFSFTFKAYLLWLLLNVKGQELLTASCGSS